MNTQFVRKAVYFAVSTLLIIGSMALVMTTFNIQAVKAAPAAQTEGGGGTGALTIHDLIYAELSQKNILIIHTTTKVNNVDTYIVHPQVNVDYYTAQLGDQFICVIQVSDPKQTQICIPFTAIATINFRQN